MRDLAAGGSAVVAMIAFFDMYPEADQAAAQRVRAAANQPPYSLQSG